MRAATLVITAFGWLALGTGLTAAQEANLPPDVVAAFNVCTQPDRSANERFALLEGAGWRVSQDDADSVALATLIHVERFAIWAPGTENYDNVIRSNKERQAAQDYQLRHTLDAGLPGGAVVNLASLEPAFAEHKVVHVEMSPDHKGAHLSIALGRLDDGMMSISCNLLLDAPVDDASRTQLTTNLGFVESDGFVQPSTAGAHSIIYKFRDGSAHGPAWVRFRSFDADGTLAQMTNDLAIPRRIGGIIETQSLRFPKD